MKKDISKYKDQLIFALDIGTRSVVGVLGTEIEGVYTVLDYEQRFHSIRAMRDGQVEDIELVSKVCREVKEALEQRNGIELTSVAIAAAGRALKTCRAHQEQTLQEDQEIDLDMVRTLEFSAIARAQDEFLHSGDGQDTRDFQCVGYSVLEYKIDGYVIRNLEGHKGTTAEVDIIAAFLPFSVVKSLYAVTSRCGLEVRNLTLEPIAAINVIVPPDVRLLNIAITDIGAGTSDVAISKQGSIVAYDMATTAGDEITESIMSEYLTDFDTAEVIKKSLDVEGDTEIEFEDILGFKYSYKSSEILEKIDGAIDALAQAIADSISNNNDGAPVAVFLIGGGSQIPGLCLKVSEKLGMPANRVALGGTRQQKHIDAGFEELMTPEFVTPLGIGTVASQYKGADFFAITVNDRRIMLMHSGTIRVLDALLLAGIKATSLMGRSSRGITYNVNGEKRHARGTPSVSGRVELNGEMVSLEADVRQGDKLTVIPAENGKDPEVHLYDIPEVRDVEGWNCVFFVNGSRQATDYLVKNLDDVQIVPVSDEEMEAYRAEDAAKAAAEALDREYESMRAETVGEEAAEPVEDAVESAVEGVVEEAEEAAVEEAAVEMVAEPAAEIVEEAEPVSQEAVEETPVAEDTPAVEEIQSEETEISEKNSADEGMIFSDDAIFVTINGESCRVAKKNRQPVRFMDLLEYTGIENEEPGDWLTLTINGRNAAYIDLVSPGDDVVIKWEYNDKK